MSQNSDPKIQIGRLYEFVRTSGVQIQAGRLHEFVSTLVNETIKPVHKMSQTVVRKKKKKKNF